MRDRLAAESSEQREARLQQMSANHCERLATESVKRREARLLQLSTNQRDRLSDETVQQREATLQRASKRDTYTSGEEPFKRCSVLLKMRRFHNYFAFLTSPKCLTCSEGIQLHPSTTECMQCYRDKYTPKLYSSPTT